MCSTSPGSLAHSPSRNRSMMGSMSMEMGEMMARMDNCKLCSHHWDDGKDGWGCDSGKGGGGDDLGEVLSGKPPD